MSKSKGLRHGDMTEEPEYILTGCCVLVTLIVFMNYANTLKS